MFKIFKSVLSLWGKKAPEKKVERAPKKVVRKKVVKRVMREEVARERDDQRQAAQKKELEIVKLLEEVNRREREVERKSRLSEEKENYLRKKEQSVEAKQRDVGLKHQEVERLRQKQLATLEKIAALSKDEARKQIAEETEKDLVAWTAKKIKEAKEKIKANEEELSREILANTLKHGVTDFVAEYTVSSIKLPSDEIKGKIIGREGRNIRAFERATGVELELDETNEVRVSSFDAVRREIAKIALQKLIRDGRIQPVRIEEVVKQTKEQMKKILLEEGKKISQAVGVYNLPIEIIETLGKYKYRFSYGQNLAIHTVEETKIGVAIAHELKADVKMVRLGCLLHDIGKVITDEEGSHVQVGVDFLKRFRLPEKVIGCVAEHHEDKPFSSLESIIAWIADAASGSRPGARYQAHEEYLKRMTQIEEIVRSFKGVKDVAAYQAGREIRIIVKPEVVSDDELTVLVHEIAKQLDEESKWAGQIKVTAIREVRAAVTAPLRNG